MKYIVTLCALTTLYTVCHGQPTGLLITTNCSSPCNQELQLAGYTTYEVFVTFTNPGDELTYYGSDGAGEIEYFLADGDVYQHPMGGFFPNNDSLLYTFFPELQCDSYFTLDEQYPQLFLLGCGQAMEDFETQGSFVMCLFVWPQQYHYYAGEDLQVRIAQITTNDSFSLCMDVAAITEGEVGSIGYYFCASSSDLNFNDAAVSILSPPNCVDETGDFQVQFEQATDFSLFLNNELYAEIIDEVEMTFVDMPQGSYMIEFENTNGCTSAELFELNAMGLEAIVNSQSPLCHNSQDGFVTYEIIESNGSVVAEFLDNENNPIAPTNLIAGTYTLVLTDEGGCMQTDTIELFNPDEIFISTSQQDVLCNSAADGSVQIDVTGGTPPYTFDDGNGNLNSDGFFEELAAGSYTFLLTDDNGCMEEVSVEIIQPSVQSIEWTIDTEDCFYSEELGEWVVEASAQVSGGIPPNDLVWNWEFDGEDYQVISNTALIHCEADLITVTAADANGCWIQFIYPLDWTDLEEFNDSQIQYFIVGPNPASQFLNIYLGESILNHDSTNFELFDSVGKRIDAFKLTASNTTYMLDVEKYERGAYVLKLMNGGVVVQSEKIILE